MFLFPLVWLFLALCGGVSSLTDLPPTSKHRTHITEHKAKVAPGENNIGKTLHVISADLSVLLIHVGQWVKHDIEATAGQT
ncbi:hypothetical protein [Synechococcus sp. CCAP 1479/9]|uniref:hypothetical protein n=1 Tax=Synechococcus sp. CCAP 1479/9 TaxID=1221593 RepID=UPI001C242E92|nr:hypothetical protein [Synechococcus sp. CCAP 1479/9]